MVAGVGAMVACAEFVSPTAGTAPRDVRAMKVLPETVAVNDGDTSRLVAVLYDQIGAPFTQLPAGVRVAWRSSSSAVAGIDSTGMVSGARPGRAQITASVLGLPLSLSVAAPVTVRAVPTAMAVATGDGQAATVGTRLPQRLQVLVTDRHGDGVPDVTVGFAVTAGKGALGADTALTDSSGIAAVAFTLDTLAGPNGVEARAARLPLALVRFTATGHAGAPAILAKASGDGQAAEAGTALSLPLVVRLADRFGNVTPGIPVSFAVVTGRGSLSASAATTDSVGQASAALTLDTIAGPNAVDARTTALPAALAHFTATAHASVPVQLQMVSGDSQGGTSGAALAAPLVARVLDRFGNVAAGATVTWEVVAGGGSIGPASVAADSLGRASAQWTLGYPEGTQNARAVLGGTVVLGFTATGRGVVASVAVSPASPTLTSGQTQLLAVTPKDAAGNALNGRPASWTSSDTTVAAVDSTGLVRTARVGTATITATVSGVAGTASVTVTPGAAARMVFTVEPSAAPSGQALAPAVAVTVQDVHGNTVPTWASAVAVALGTNPGSATLGGTLSQTPVSGVATFADLTVSLGGVGYTMVASSSGLPAATSTAFTVSGTSYPMTIDVPGPDLIGVALTNPLDITLSQPAGAGGVTVTLTADAASVITPAAPGTVVIPQGATTGRIALNGLALGTTTVRASAIGYTTAALSVQVTDQVVPVASVPFEAGYYGTCAIRSGGILWCWGHGQNPTQVAGSGYVAATIGGHQCALKADGTAFCWGADNSSGQLGDGTNNSSATPVAVAGGLKFARIIAGNSYTCGLTTAGAAYCWGEGQFGKLGNGSLTNVNAPTPVLGGHTFAVLTVGATFTACALTTGGEAYCWGDNSWGEIGDAANGTPRTAPSAVVGGLQFAEIGAGDTFTCGRTAAGAVWCWGANDQGQLGKPANNPIGTFSPLLVAGANYASLAVAAAGLSSCGVTLAGAAECWGWNTAGQLGDGTFSPHYAPAAVTGGLQFARVSAGAEHTCGLTTAGELWCWGRNLARELGDGTTSNHPSPIPVMPGKGVQLTFAVQPSVATAGQPIAPAVKVSVRDAFGNLPATVSGSVTLAIGNDPSGGVAALGGTTSAAVVNGVATFSDLTLNVGGSGFTLVASLIGAPGATSAAFDVTATVVVPPVLLTAGVAHSCEIRLAGAVWCWGDNASGQLGDGTTTQRPLPVAVATGLSFVAVSAGDDHTCALTSAGAAYCWGANAGGQLGTGNTAPSLTPVAVTGGIPFVQVLAGQTFTCGLSATGSAYCWGINGGKLGDGNPSSNPLAPQPVSGGLTFTALSLFGNNHTCGLATGGAAYCWGYNLDGELGDGTQADRYVPTAVAGSLTFTSIASATFHGCGLTSTGAAYCWGDNNVSQLGWGSPPTDQLSPGAINGSYTFTSLVAGASHTCGLRASGAAICWGFNGAGGLGDGTTTTRLAPAPVSGGLTFVRIAAGGDYTCGQTVTSQTWCWGANGSGQLGNGNTLSRGTPSLVGVIAIVSVVVTPASAAMAVGSTVQLTAEPRDAGGTPLVGRTVTWSSGDAGIATVDATGLVTGQSNGIVTITATSEGVSGTSDLSVGGLGASPGAPGALSAGWTHTCEIRAGGTAYCWGASNSFGEIGDGTNTTRLVPTKVSSSLVFTQIASGLDHTCALDSSSLIWCWGRGRNGQIGAAGTSNVATPFRALSGGPFVQVVAGDAVTCGLVSGGDAYCWGIAPTNGSSGSVDALVPTAVRGALKFSSLAAFADHVCGITQSALTYCWGYGSKGQLGTGFTTFQTSLPQQVTGGNTFTQVAVGGLHSCAITAAGAAWCWGDNTLGALGNGVTTTTPELSPVAVQQGALVFTSVVAGNGHSCALQADGTAWCWGDNTSGQLGAGDQAAHITPTAVSSGLQFVLLSAGDGYTCGHTATHLYCWGSGALGDGTTNPGTTPVLIF